MSRTRARPPAALAWAGAVAAVLATTPPAGAVSGAAAFDADDVFISGSRADFDGTLAWSHAKDGPDTVGKLSGRLSAETGCAEVRVDWLDSGTGALKSSNRSTCAGSERVSLRFRHASLECARVRLFVSGDQTGATRLLCAGGS